MAFLLNNIYYKILYSIFQRTSIIIIIINTVNILPFIYTCNKKSIYFMCFRTCFLIFSFTLLISFNTSKIRIIYITAKKYSVYFIYISYVIKHSSLTCIPYVTTQTTHQHISNCVTTISQLHCNI